MLEFIDKCGGINTACDVLNHLKLLCRELDFLSKDGRIHIRDEVIKYLQSYEEPKDDNEGS